MKKKIVATVLSVILLAGLAACGNSASGSAANGTQETPEATEVPEATEMPETSEVSENPEGTEAAEATTDGSKTLVVYYSASGNTENIAQIIADSTGGDLFELEPVEPYTDADLDWTDDSSRVSVEHENPDQREVELAATTVANWDEYDTVYIGYPIWWAIAAWPVNNFVESNNFEGKTVIPFCTAATSDIGESGQLLEEMAGTGNWVEGRRFHGSDSNEEVKEWIDSLGNN